MTEKLTLELRPVLPEAVGTQDACIQRLTDLLRAKEGIGNAHVLADSSPDRICVHYDPGRVSTGQVRQLAQRAGADLASRYGHASFSTAPMTARRARCVSSRASRVPGAIEAIASPSGSLRIEFDRRQTDQDAILRDVGEIVQLSRTTSTTTHDSSPRTKGTHDADDHSPLGGTVELAFTLACGTLLLAGWLLSFLAGVHPWVSTSLFGAASFFGGFFPAREAIENLRTGTLEIDSLMLVAAAGAASLGELAEGALLLFLFSLGHALEHFAMGRAKRSIEALADIAPTSAEVRRGNFLETVQIDRLVVGDVVVIKPNTRVPVDGLVIMGESNVDQAPITGESVPVAKLALANPPNTGEQAERVDSQHRVFAGTINQDGVLEVMATKLSSESTLSRVVELVREAETSRSPTQQFTDRFERYFVRAILVSVFLLLFAWVVRSESFSTSFYRAMAVLVAASPCALAIATPSAVLSGIARAAKGGVLVKERLSSGIKEALDEFPIGAFIPTRTHFASARPPPM